MEVVVAVVSLLAVVSLITNVVLGLRVVSQNSTVHDLEAAVEDLSRKNAGLRAGMQEVAARSTEALEKLKGRRNVISQAEGGRERIRALLDEKRGRG